MLGFCSVESWNKNKLLLAQCTGIVRMLIHSHYAFEGIVNGDDVHGARQGVRSPSLANA